MSWLPDGFSAIFQDFEALDLHRNMRVPKINCTILGVPIRKDYSIQGSILGSPYLRKLPYPCGLNSGTASSAAAFMQPQALILSRSVLNPKLSVCCGKNCYDLAYLVSKEQGNTMRV